MRTGPALTIACIATKPWRGWSIVHSRNLCSSASARSRAESASSGGVEMTKNAPVTSSSSSADGSVIQRTSASTARSAATFSTASRSPASPMTTQRRPTKLRLTG